jgi:hypothetical protein
VVTFPELKSFIPSDNDLENFWSQVTKTDACWIWTGKQLSGKGKGYGYFTFSGIKVFCHRFSYQLYKGRIPAGSVCCHSCDNPSCVNPDHLWAGTQAQNIKDMVNKKRNSSGFKITSAKLKPEQVQQIRHIYSLGGITQKQLGIQFGVSLPTINDVVTRRHWKHIT